MKTVAVKNVSLEIPQIGLGCMRLSELQNEKNVNQLIETAMENGINFFDHADVYGLGEAEELFGKCMTESLREKIILQSKCGIHLGEMFDFSKEHILKSVDKSLKRLQTDYLDILLLHRPDTLVDCEEVAEAFAVLEEQGKVKYFGVSNQNPMQIALINKYCNNKILFNQMQFSIVHSSMVDAGFNVNTMKDEGIVRDGSVLEYCRLNDIAMQAWSPFQSPHGVFVGNEKYPELNAKLEEIANKYDVTPSAIAVAWILRHPAKIQTIVGTTSKERLAQICKASDVVLERAEWYEIYRASGKILP